MEFLTIFEVAPYALALNKWPSGEYAYVNAEWTKHFGYTQLEVNGKTTTELGMYYHVHDRDRFVEHLRREGRARGFEISIKTKAGVPRLISVNVDQIELRGQQYLLSAIEDITERRKTEESLFFALDSARMGTWAIDLENDRVQCSPPMMKLWGLDPRTFTGDRSALQKKVHPEDVEPMRRAIRESIENRSIYQMEYRIHPAPGEERWVNSRGRCTYDPGTDKPTRFSGVVFDVTEERKARDTAELAIKARDNMISISAHELLTPISGVKLRLQTLKMKLERGAELNREDLIRLSAQTDISLNRLSKLVKDMLDISRINLGKLTLHRERTDLSALVTNTLDNSMVSLESAGCPLNTEIEPGIESSLDAYRIEQVLSNLISNACRYAAGKPVDISLRKTGPFARLTVLDRGIGIDKKDHGRIFERFERATSLNENAGLGLGLFLVKQIVEAHGGRVAVESSLGHGAKFLVELPLGGVGP